MPKKANLYLRNVGPKILTIFSLVLLFGCTTNILKLGFASEKVPSKKVKLTLVKKNAQSQDSRAIIWFIPLGVPNTNKIIKQILNEYNGDVVQNLKVDLHFFWVYFFGKITYIATGDVYKIIKSEDGDIEDNRNTKHFILSKGGKNVLYKK